VDVEDHVRFGESVLRVRMSGGVIEEVDE
jgi:hypothetical protein